MLISQGGGFDPYSETLTPGIPKWSKTLVFPTNHYKEFGKRMKSTPKLGAYLYSAKPVCTDDEDVLHSTVFQSL